MSTMTSEPCGYSSKLPTPVMVLGTHDTVIQMKLYVEIICPFPSNREHIIPKTVLV